MEIPLDPIFAAFGLAATVTPAPAGSPITTTIVWLPTVTEDMPLPGEFRRKEPIRVLCLRRDEVPSAPRGTLIVAPEVPGGADRTWRVDGVDRAEADLLRVTVLPVEGA